MQTQLIVAEFQAAKSAASTASTITTLIAYCLCGLIVAATAGVNIAPAFISWMGAQTDVSQRFDLIAVWMVFFGALWCCFYTMWRSVPNTGLDSPQNAKVAASRCISTTHAFLVISFGVWNFFRQQLALLDIQSLRANTALEQRILEISGGFFLVDIVVLLVNTGCKLCDQQSILLMCHHSISLFYMLTMGAVGYGSSTTVAILIVAESTSPCVTMWTLARVAKSERHLRWTSPLFTFTFSIMRFVGMTLMMIDSSPKFQFGENPGNVHIAWRLIWNFVLIFLCLGGWIWSVEAIKGLCKFYSKKSSSLICPSPILTAHQMKQVAPMPSLELTQVTTSDPACRI